MTTVFFDVDTQHGFVFRNGAAKILPNLKSLTNYARRNSIKVMASKDNSISENALKSKIEETSMKNPVEVYNKEYEKHHLKNMLKNRREFLIHKHDYSMLSNPNSEHIIKSLGVKKAVVYGVATDYCVLGTVKDLRRIGIDVALVSDGIAALDYSFGDGEIALDEMRKLGIKEIKTIDVLKGVY